MYSAWPFEAIARYTKINDIGHLRVSGGPAIKDLYALAVEKWRSEISDDESSKLSGLAGRFFGESMFISPSQSSAVPARCTTIAYI